ARHDTPAASQFSGRERQEAVEVQLDDHRAADRFLQPDQRRDDPREDHAARADVRASEQHPAGAIDKSWRERRVLSRDTGDTKKRNHEDTKARRKSLYKEFFVPSCLRGPLFFAPRLED